MRPACIDAAAVTDVVASLYGSEHGEAVASATGVVQVTAVWQGGPGRYITLRITDETPRSACDWFVLSLARARADAIITSGKILREEPDMTHALQGPSAAGLAAWRRQVAGKSDPPVVLILTGGQAFPMHHPALRGPRPAILYTTGSGATALRARPGAADIRIHGTGAPTIRAAIAYLRDELGCRTIVIETGPTTANALYEPPVTVDELMLSVCCAPSIPRGVRGPAFVGPDRLRAIFAHSSPVNEAAEPGGVWRFCRLTRGSDRPA